MRTEKTIGMLLGVCLLGSACLVPSTKYNDLETHKENLEWQLGLEQKKSRFLQDYIDGILEGNTRFQHAFIYPKPVPTDAYQWNREALDRIYTPYVLNTSSGQWIPSDLFSDVKLRLKENSIVFELESQLLFDVGSSKVQAEGEQQLNKLVDWINKEKKVNQREYILRVEGHTDKGELFDHPQWKDTWTLSVMRAIEVVRLLSKAGIAKDKLIASGRGEYKPDNSARANEEARPNRRVKILLSPVETPN